MIDSQVLSFALAAALLTVTPGQDTLLVIRNVVRGGRRDGVVTTFGICSGVFVHAALSAFGLSIVLTHSTATFHVVKALGAGYLVWLGIRSLASAARREYEPVGQERSAAVAVVPGRRCFLEGLLSNVLNPKTAIFYLAFLPQFVSATDPALQKSLLLAAIHVGEGIVWLVLVSLAVGRMRRRLPPTFRRWLDGFCGALFVSLGVRLALERQ
jgi:RhtB (resistance to homoserine/threonine) family protein